VTLARRYPVHALAAALCLGLAFANATRITTPLLLVAGAGAALRRGLFVALSVALLGWWWGSVRLVALDRSPLAAEIGTAERARVVVTGDSRRGRFDQRAPGRVVRYGRLHPNEPVLLRFSLERAPPQGAVIDALGVVKAPRPAGRGFDERLWLRRRGVHVVLRLDEWRIVGHRGGLGGVADRLRRWLRGSSARGLEGERAGVLEGIVLGDDGGLSDELRQRFRASGLYHLLAVSGQNVALVAAGALALAWLVGAPRWAGQIGALAGIGAYVLAVGPQPSVVRAGIAGALGSLAWLSARMTDRWYFLLVGAAVLLAWNPYTVFDAGFQLSFAAVGAIFVLVPRLRRRLDGYPLPEALADAVAVSVACGLATAPVMWLQFHAVPLLTVPANALVAPAMVPVLALALIGAVVEPIAPAATGVLAWVNGWLAAYIAACARVIGGLPGAQIHSTRALLMVVVCALLVCAFAVRPQRGRTPTSS
jgi:competence protein ComEC